MHRLTLLGVALGAIVMSSIPVAHASTIKDERSTGSPYGSKSDAIADIASLSAEKDGSSIDVVIKKRAGAPADSGGSLVVHINTVGGPTSVPEFDVNGESVTPAGSGEQTGKAKFTRSDGGKRLSFSIPIKALNSPASVAIQVQSGGEGAVDIAPGGHFFGRDPEPEKNRRYLKVFKADRVIEGSVDLACSSGTSCTRAPVMNAEVKAVGGKTYEAVTNQDGKFELGVEKGTYSVTSDAGDLRVTTKARKVDVKKRTRGTARFEACGTTGGGAELRAVNGGTWFGGNRECLNKVKIVYTSNPYKLLIYWTAIPKCKPNSLSGERVDPTQSRLLLNGDALDPAARGHRLVVADTDVTFSFPLAKEQFFFGTLTNQSANVEAIKTEGLCSWILPKMSLPRTK